MVVVSLTDCPPRLRGDLSKWMMEINTGVYVGNMSARVRDELWERICENIKNGRATMVYSARNEQGMAFRVHNTTWEPVDMGGITLMRRPTMQSQNAEQSGRASDMSKAAIYQKARKMQAARAKFPTSYVVLDIETSGTFIMDDSIIEVAAIRCIEGEGEIEFARLIRIDGELPPDIAALTGITDDMLKAEGVECGQAMRELTEFMGNLPVICHNAVFDIGFIRQACMKHGVAMPRSRVLDTIDISRRILKHLPDRKLSTLASVLGIEQEGAHRALADCRTLKGVYDKLNENA